MDGYLVKVTITGTPIEYAVNASDPFTAIHKVLAHIEANTMRDSYKTSSPMQTEVRAIGGLLTGEGD